MSAVEFLKQHVPDYAALTESEQSAIADFTLLWSAMEGLLLKGEANPTSLANKVVEMEKRGWIDIGSYQKACDYFRARYYENGAFTYRFGMLRFRKNDRRETVEEFLCGAAADSVGVLTALLLIVYRLRNNLFHGAKWEYGIKDQQQNFEMEAEVLKLVLDAPRRVGLA